MAKKSRSAGKDEFRALVERKMKELRQMQIPTDEDFARADAHMAAQNRMFATIRGDVFNSFASRIPLHDIFLFPGPTTDFEAYVFYESDADIDVCRASGVEQAIKDAISQAFAARRDNGTPPTVTFNFDSHENVKKQCNGNYHKYPR